MNAIMANSQEALDKHRVYDRLMQTASGLQNDHVLATMLASQCAGEGELPYRLGLLPADYEQMMACHFPTVQLPMSFMIWSENFPDRQDEIAELSTLILNHRADESAETQWMANILTAGCMGGNHLWQDLGLWSRKDLSALIVTNFPQLAARNDKDMKWKKFFYKQLCIAEGIYVCRSPSCEVCPDYSDCFSPED